MANSYGKMLSQYDLFSNGIFGLIAQKTASDKVQFMKGHVFERCLVEVMVEMAEKKGLKHKPLAIAAWQDRKDAGTKWRKIRNGTDPRGFRVDDAYDLAVAMGVSFVELCGMAQGRLVELESSRGEATRPSKNDDPENKKNCIQRSTKASTGGERQLGTDAG